MKPLTRPALLVTLPLTLLALLLAVREARSAPQAPAPVPQRTVILVRHAEKAGDDPRDPSLSESGRARAEALAKLLAPAGATRLVASEYRRTQETLAPLAAALELELERAPAGELEQLALSLLAMPPGATVVVAGHSNTVPALAARLGAPLAGVGSADRPALDEAEFDRLFVLTLPPAGSALAPRVLELAYGESSP
jgi:phosphohistidine phosphatase SixA